SAASGRPRPGHRRPNVHWWSRKPILTPPMESKAEIVAMDGDVASRGAPVIALSHVRGLRGGLGRVIGGRMCTDGAENRFRSEEHTSELQSREKLVCRHLLEKKKCPYIYGKIITVYTTNLH